MAERKYFYFTGGVISIVQSLLLIFVMSQSVVSLAQSIPPIVAGFLTSINMNLPTMFAAGTTFIAWLVLMFLFKKSKQTVNIQEEIKVVK